MPGILMCWASYVQSAKWSKADRQSESIRLGRNVMQAKERKEALEWNSSCLKVRCGVGPVRRMVLVNVGSKHVGVLASADEIVLVVHGGVSSSLSSPPPQTSNDGCHNRYTNTHSHTDTDVSARVGGRARRLVVASDSACGGGLHRQSGCGPDVGHLCVCEGHDNGGSAAGRVD